MVVESMEREEICYVAFSAVVVVVVELYFREKKSNRLSSQMHKFELSTQQLHMIKIVTHTYIQTYTYTITCMPTHSYTYTYQLKALCIFETCIIAHVIYNTKISLQYPSITQHAFQYIDNHLCFIWFFRLLLLLPLHN